MLIETIPDLDLSKESRPWFYSCLHLRQARCADGDPVRNCCLHSGWSKEGLAAFT